jgi:hypothetical protein
MRAAWSLSPAMKLTRHKFSKERQSRNGILKNTSFLAGQWTTLPNLVPNQTTFSLELPPTSWRKEKGRKTRSFFLPHRGKLKWRGGNQEAAIMSHSKHGSEKCKYTASRVMIPVTLFAIRSGNFVLLSVIIFLKRSFVMNWSEGSGIHCLHMSVLWHVDPLPGNYRETNH